jgi:phosphatidylinositol-3-phosphatase
VTRRLRWATVLGLTLAVTACTSSASAGHTAGPTTSTSASSSASSSVDAITATSPPSGRTSSPAARQTSTVPTPAHVVIVVEENHAYGDILGSSSAPYFRSLAAGGASFTQFYAITHPSEPNYVALFSGSTQGLTDDSCPHSYRANNLGNELRAAHHSFAGYSEGLPSTGYRGCTTGHYARRHVPWTNFTDLPASVNQPYTAFPSDYSRLPTVSFVIPNLDHDMHDGTVAQADSWLKSHLGSYATWAKAHNSLLVVTWDEDDHSEGNRIPTIVTGAHVRTGHYAEHADLYRLLRTVEAMYHLPALGAAAQRSTITDMWN